MLAPMKTVLWLIACVAIAASGCDFGANSAKCGNSIVEIGEDCEPGSGASAVCDSACKFICGNGTLNSDEQCDDGNRVDGDGCDSTCKLECGNGNVDANEQCDDGNQKGGDGCDSDCKLECGNGKLDFNETCDASAGSPSGACGCTDACKWAVAGSSCSDDNACTGSDACDGAGTCKSKALSCDDKNAGTSDTCYAAVGCAHLKLSDTTGSNKQGGGTSGTLFEDVCPAGKVLVGIAGQVDKNGMSLNQLGGVCGPISISSTLAISIGADDTSLPLRGSGNNGDMPVISKCPANQVVVGFAGYADINGVYLIAAACAPLTASYGATGFSITIGNTADQSAIGVTGGMSFGDTKCINAIATGTSIRDGKPLGEFAVTCATMSIVSP